MLEALDAEMRGERLGLLGVLGVLGPLKLSNAEDPSPSFGRSLMMRLGRQGQKLSCNVEWCM